LPTLLLPDALRTLPWVLVVSAVLALGGCAQPGAAPSMSSSAEGSFEEAVAGAIDDLFAQTQPQTRLPGVLATLESKIVQQAGGRRAVMADPVIEAGSGNQTVATRAIDARIVERVAAKFPNIELLPYQAANVAKAQYLLTGTMGRAGAAAGGSGYRIDLALTEVKGRSIAARASARARAQGIDTTPTAYYRDSPVLVRDNLVEQMEATSRANVGQPTSAAYLDGLQASTLLADATAAYDGDHIEQALALYTQALAAPGGDQIRVHNGIYLANWRLGRVADAEQAFGRVVASGLANRNLGVKFLFKTNTTDFWPDPKVSAPYEFWLRQIARQASASRACLNVVGHTSRTGSEQYNDQLSQRRALYIKQRLEAESAELAARMRASGMGFRENLVGTGTDDIRDALDRRVEFKVDAC
jgi:outer membrane protein OmpA-like peptidoglycan-associated protein